MNIGLYSAYLGMRARQHTLDVIANNIANASTAGFKADHLFYRSIEAAEVEAARRAAAAPANAASATSAPNTTTPGPANNPPGNPPGSQANSQVSPNTPADPLTQGAELTLPDRVFGVLTSGLMDLAPGSIRDTGRALDVALDGQGFLAVQTPRGERYTRAGALTLDANGQLVTQSGELVIGQGGPITLPPGQATIGEDGSVSVGSQIAGRLKIVRFNDPRTALMKEGGTLFAPTGTERPREDTQTRLAQGALEMSNVNAIGEMAAMMQNSREFDSLERSITLMMSARKTAAEVGKI
jgi:flagellar basal-body rod protein FlgF